MTSFASPQVLVPAAFPSILTGMKIGWAFAWRTLIAAELVFGVTSNQGGLGWFIFESRNSLITPSVFAGLLTVMVVGLIIYFSYSRKHSTVQRQLAGHAPPTAEQPSTSAAVP